MAAKLHPDKNKSDHAPSERSLKPARCSQTRGKGGHQAYLETSFDLGDQPEARLPFSLSDFFQDFDESSYVDEAHFHWSSETPNFSFYFEDLDENEELDIPSAVAQADGKPQKKTDLLHVWPFCPKEDRDVLQSREKPDSNVTMMEEVKDVSAGSVHGDTISVAEVLQDGDNLTFIIVSQKLSGTGEYHVDRTYDDFEWLQQHLYTQEDVPGIQGVIFPPLPVRPQVNASAKVLKQLGFLALGEWQPYCRALETFLKQVVAHSLLSKNQAVELFLTSADPPGRQKIKKNLFNRLSQAMEEMRKEGHKDVDEFFQAVRDQNLQLTGPTRIAAEKFLDVVLTEQKIAVACGHFSAALHLCLEPGEDPAQKAFSRVCVKLSEVFDEMRKSTKSFSLNDMNTLGLGLDLESRHQEAEKEMLFRRTCKLVELENARKNAERAKPVKKAAMEEVKKASETEFEHICEVSKQEISRFQRVRVEMLQKSLIQWCEKQLLTAKESADVFSHHLDAFKSMT